MENNDLTLSELVGSISLQRDEVVIGQDVDCCLLCDLLVSVAIFASLLFQYEIVHIACAVSIHMHAYQRQQSARSFVSLCDSIAILRTRGQFSIGTSKAHHGR